MTLDNQRLFKDLSSLQGHLKDGMVKEVYGRITDICVKIARKNIQEKVYDAYIPQGEFAYDRTYQLLNAVTVGNIQIGLKYLTFDIFMDSEKILPQETGQNQWNKHADIEYNQDVSEYIPMWVEEGTTGSLWDRDGAHYMEATTFELGGGILARELAKGLRSQGWDVKFVS